MRRAASIGAIILGILMIVGGGATWFVVSDTLDRQEITVAEDASCLAGQQVNGPFTAYCQADIIEEHTLNSTDGLTYAQLDQDDPRRELAMNSSFLQASLFTSVLAFGVSAMAIGMGVIFILIGLGIRDVAERTEPLTT